MMIVSRLAIALAERFNVDIVDAISQADPDARSVEIIEPLDGYLSKDKIIYAHFDRHQSSEVWNLNVRSPNCIYREESITEATIILIEADLPATITTALGSGPIDVSVAI